MTGYSNAYESLLPARLGRRSAAGPFTKWPPPDGYTGYDGVNRRSPK